MPMPLQFALNIDVLIKSLYVLALEVKLNKA